MGNSDDEFLLKLAKMIDDEQGGVYVRNKKKSELVEKTAQTFRQIIDCDRIFIKIDTPFMGSTDVCMTGKEIHIKNPRRFGELVRLATNSEVYPKTDGTVQMNLTYYGTSIKRK